MDENATRELYDPLTDDAQAMALVKRFWLEPRYNEHRDVPAWMVTPSYKAEPCVISTDLNRAIVECVAKMQADNKAFDQPHHGHSA